jgi:putative transposase
MITPLMKGAESMRRPRRNHSATFTAKVALAAVKGDHTLAQLAERIDVHPNQITQWKTESLQRAAEVFATAAEKRETDPDIKTLHAKIGQSALETDFSPGPFSRIGDASTTMIDAVHGLPITRQARVLELSRSAVYFQPQPTTDAPLALLRRIDALHLDHPFAGSQMLRDLLRQEGCAVECKHVASPMRTMGLEALYRKANTSWRHPAQRNYPYLPRALAIDRPNQAWAMDIDALRFPSRSVIAYDAAVAAATMSAALAIPFIVVLLAANSLLRCFLGVERRRRFIVDLSGHRHRL